MKLFVTHSGFLSTTETVYNGVPIVAIPVAGDQKMNAVSSTNAGFGVHIFMDDLTESTLSEAIEEVMTNPK